MSSLGKLQEELLMCSLCEVTANVTLQNIPDLLVLHWVKLFDKMIPSCPGGRVRAEQEMEGVEMQKVHLLT